MKIRLMIAAACCIVMPCAALAQPVDPKPAASPPAPTTPEAPKPAPEPAKPEIARAAPQPRTGFEDCVIKPVMSDDDLRKCGATPPKY
jgi:hypothetical protein